MMIINYVIFLFDESKISGLYSSAIVNALEILQSCTKPDV